MLSVWVKSWQGVSKLLDWNLEWNGGMENRLMYAVTPNLCNWHCSIYFELPTMFHSSYMYCNGCISKLGYFLTKIMSLSENGAFHTIGIPWTHSLLLSYSTIHDGGHTYYCQGRLPPKIVRDIEVTKD